MARARVDQALLDRDLAVQLAPWLKRVGNWAEGIAKQDAVTVVQKQTGDYQRKIDSMVTAAPTGIGVACRLVALSEHSAVIELGSKSHVIRATNPSGRLKFRVNVTVNSQGQIAGATWRSPQEVLHPGTKPHRILQNAMMSALEANGCRITDRRNINYLDVSGV